ncbi:hypothetical protein [Arthrobacter sp. ISL-72]|uniref:hypothetical protein n=1 Tax=Arthrobacter sp. ISL-72 TaxID=2819114 RepID=UPI001BE8742A|nr:hypothetical protein [Arthrobacter sp. ISL-72]MBT2594259.1 hypothetical protein [Arthrobacter sp. ISL-72]
MKARAGSAAAAARKRVSDTAALASGRFSEISRKESEYAPKNGGQRAQLMIAATGVAAAAIVALIWRACTRSSRPSK